VFVFLFLFFFTSPPNPTRAKTHKPNPTTDTLFLPECSSAEDFTNPYKLHLVVYHPHSLIHEVPLLPAHALLTGLVMIDARRREGLQRPASDSNKKTRRVWVREPTGFEAEEVAIALAVP